MIAVIGGIGFDIKNGCGQDGVRKQTPAITPSFQGLQVDRGIGGEPLLDLSNASLKQAEILAGQVRGD